MTPLLSRAAALTAGLLFPILACAVPPSSPPVAVQSSPAPPSPPPAPSSPAAATDFPVWLEGVKRDALAKGISPRTVEVALAKATLIPRVIELDRRQPEFTVTFAGYLASATRPERIAKGRTLMRENRRLLRKVSAKFHVQPQYIVALWGIETDFGKLTGNFPVIDALATLAYDGRRSAYFRGQLMDALKIVDQGDIAPEAMRGSWAGAMGQTQFMPSAYLKYAVDFDGAGRRDIWTDRADALASIANYLSQVGWQGTRSWGREVRLPAGFDPARTPPGVKKPLKAWRKLGIRPLNGGRLPNADLDAVLVLPEGKDGRAVLGYDNYQSILQWNRSAFFALAVGQLADRLAGR